MTPRPPSPRRCSSAADLHAHHSPDAIPIRALRPPRVPRTPPRQAVQCVDRLHRRPARILLNAATALSLVLCVAAAALWARSYFVADSVYSRSGATSHAALTSTKGT